MAKKKDSDIRFRIVSLIAIVLFAIMMLQVPSMVMGKREKFISLKEDIMGGQLAQGNYACCLAKPCTYCIEKTPSHGENEACHCLEDIYNGVHPCGECIGEILEGHGNPFVAPYFATAIAEKTGQIDAIKQIIFEKYGTPLEEQV